MSLSEQIKELIKDLRFEEAYNLLTTTDMEIQEKIVINISMDSNDILILGFTSYILSVNNTYENHRLAMLSYYYMSWVEGAYELSYYHALLMLKMSNCLKDKIAVLDYYRIPGFKNIMTHDLALKLADDILSEDDTNRLAIEVRNSICSGNE